MCLCNAMIITNRNIFKQGCIIPPQTFLSIFIGTMLPLTSNKLSTRVDLILGISEKLFKLQWLHNIMHVTQLLLCVLRNQIPNHNCWHIQWNIQHLHYKGPLWARPHYNPLLFDNKVHDKSLENVDHFVHLRNHVSAKADVDNEIPQPSMDLVIWGNAYLNIKTQLWHKIRSLPSITVDRFPPIFICN